MSDKNKDITAGTAIVFADGVTRTIKPLTIRHLRGFMKAVKNLVKKAGKALTGGSDEDQRKDLQRKMGVPQTGKKPMQK